MSNTRKMFFVFNCIYTLILYYSYYHSTVFEQKSITIDSGWVVLKFFLLYGSPIIIVVCLVDNWNLAKSYLFSFGLWFCVYVFEAVTRSKEFTALYPNSYQCYITAISVYLGIGLSVLFGNFVGGFAKIILDVNSQEVKDATQRDKKFSWVKSKEDI